MRHATRLTEVSITKAPIYTSAPVFHVSHTRLDGRYVLRLAVGNLRTTEDDVRRAWEVLRTA